MLGIYGPCLGTFPPLKRMKNLSVFLRVGACIFPACPSRRRNVCSWYTHGATQCCRLRRWPSNPPPPRSVLVRLRAALRVAFGSRNWKMTPDILHLAPSDGGLGLWMPEVYLYSTHAWSF